MPEDRSGKGSLTGGGVHVGCGLYLGFGVGVDVRLLILGGFASATFSMTVYPNSVWTKNSRRQITNKTYTMGTFRLDLGPVIESIRGAGIDNIVSVV